MAPTVKDASTQYNLYLINKFNMKNKSVACNIIEADIEFHNQEVKKRVKPLQKSVSTQLAAFKVNKATQSLGAFKVNKATQLSTASKVNKATLNKETQCYTFPVNIPPKTYDAKRKSTVDKSISVLLKTMTKSSQTKPLLDQEFLWSISKLINCAYPEELNYAISEDLHNQVLLRITRKRAVGILHSECGLDPIELSIWESGKCHLNVLFKPAKEFLLQKVPNSNEDCDTLPKEKEIEGAPNETKGLPKKGNEEEIRKILDIISGRLGHTFCPGVNETIVNNRTESRNCFLPKSLKIFSYPFRRHQSVRCEVFYPYYLTKFPKNPKSKQCKFCAALTKEISKARKRKANETLTCKYKREQITSNYPIQFLPPKSKEHRLARLRKLRFQMRRKISNLEKKLADRQLELSDPLSKEMSPIV